MVRSFVQFALNHPLFMLALVVLFDPSQCPLG